MTINEFAKKYDLYPRRVHDAVWLAGMNKTPYEKNVQYDEDDIRSAMLEYLREQEKQYEIVLNRHRDMIKRISLAKKGPI